MAAASLSTMLNAPAAFVSPICVKQPQQALQQHKQRQEMTHQQQMALWQLMMARAARQQHQQKQQQQQLLSQKGVTSPLGSPLRYSSTTQPTLYSINISEVERLRQQSSPQPGLKEEKQPEKKTGEEGSKPKRRPSESNFSIEFILKKDEVESSKSPQNSPLTPASPSPSAFQLPKAFIYTPPQKYEQVYGGMVYGSAGLSRSLKRRRKLRTVFSSKQLAGLERAFTEKKYLSVPDRIKLAMELELSDTQVKTWFQNRRMKEKKLQEGTPQQDSDSERAESPSSPISLSSLSLEGDNLVEEECMDEE